MCGIFGCLNLDGKPPDERLGIVATDLLHHRGPDSGATRTDFGAGVSVFLGHRRLKIIDLSDCARQPMPNEDESVWVVFNGEIYNFPSLRSELEASGHRFRSRSDTEVIVHAYEQFGDDFVRRMDGMFAFAIWDRSRGRLVLARDRSGKKPLFYAHAGDRFVFASEIKSILLYSPEHREPAIEALPELLTFGMVHAPRTVYQGIWQLPPASYMTVDRRGVHEPIRYWRLNFAPKGTKPALSFRGSVHRVRELVTQAVERRLLSDVPLGALLSGGLDSSIIVGIMSQLSDQPVRTFTVGFDDAGERFDERAAAAVAARSFGTRHTEFIVKADYAGLLERLLWHHDQPYGDSSALPAYLICQVARQQVTVALSGDGGDEVFAGYERYFGALLAQSMPAPIGAFGKSISRRLPRKPGYYSLQRRLQRFFENADRPLRDRYLGWLSFFDSETRSRLLRSNLPAKEQSPVPESLLDPYFNDAADLPLLHQLLYVEFRSNLPDDLLVKIDRAAMANSLETRSPMLDTELMEFMASLPPEWKIRRTSLKYILKCAFRDMLPPELLRRKKHGFAVPLGRWFRGEMRPLVEDLIFAADSHSRMFFDPIALRELYDEHLRAAAEHGHRLWLLLNIELWLRMMSAGKLWSPLPVEPPAVQSRDV